MFRCVFHSPPTGPSPGPWMISEQEEVVPTAISEYHSSPLAVVRAFFSDENPATWGITREEQSGNLRLIVASANFFFEFARRLSQSPLRCAEWFAQSNHLALVLHDTEGSLRKKIEASSGSLPHSRGPWHRSLSGAIYGEKNWQGTAVPLIVPVIPSSFPPGTEASHRLSYFPLFVVAGAEPGREDVVRGRSDDHRIQQQKFDTQYILACCNAFFSLSEQWQAVNPVAVAETLSEAREEVAQCLPFPETGL